MPKAATKPSPALLPLWRLIIIRNRLRWYNYFLQHCYIYYICIHVTPPHTVIRLPKYRRIIAATFLLVYLFIITPVQWLHSHKEYPPEKAIPGFPGRLACSLCEQAKNFHLPVKHHHIQLETETCTICAHLVYLVWRHRF